MIGERRDQRPGRPADQHREAERRHEQAEQQAQPGAHARRHPAVLVVRLHHVRLAVGVLGDEGRRLHLEPVLDPLLEFAEVGLGGVEVAVRGDQDQFVVVIHASIVTQITVCG